MAYNINLSDGSTLISVPDGTVDQTTCSIALIGKNFAGYGEFLNENYVHMMENFAYSNSPPNPLKGQLWWDTTNKLLKVCTTGGETGTWKPVSGTTTSSVAPSTATSANGDLWWDSQASQLKVYQNGEWIVVGPSYTATTGKTGAIADGVSDGANTYFVIKFFIHDNLVAILSKDTFTPVSLTGFAQIKSGFNFSSIYGSQYWGDANNALNLGGIAANKYALIEQPNTFTQPLTIESDSGLNIGTDFNIGVNGNVVNLTGLTQGKDLSLRVNVGGVIQTLLTLNSLGHVTVASDPVSTEPMGVATKQYVDNSLTLFTTMPSDPTLPLGIATKQYVDAQVASVTFTPSITGALLFRDGQNSISGNILPENDNMLNFGSSANRFNTIFASTFNGTALSANYADLAERFESDRVYRPGTVVELGGPAEITAVIDDLSDNVFGVISSKAAYLMNASAGSDTTHPPIAMQGRVPVRVIGKVMKGDRLVSAGNGLARSAIKSEITSFNVIGRALSNKFTTDEGTVEAVVKLNS